MRSRGSAFFAFFVAVVAGAFVWAVGFTALSEILSQHGWGGLWTAILLLISVDFLLDPNTEKSRATFSSTRFSALVSLIVFARDVLLLGAFGSQWLVLGLLLAGLLRDGARELTEGA